MAETTTRARRDSGDLSALLLPELRKIATNLGIEGAGDMKKPDLVTAITDLQAANREAAKAEREARRAARNQRRQRGNDNQNSDNDDNASEDESEDSDSPSTNNANPNESNDSRNDRGYDRNDREWRRDRHRDRNRGRDRDRGGREREIVLSEDDVLLPVGGLLDILENYAFLRTGGYCLALTMCMSPSNKFVDTDFAKVT